jgi:NAD(P)H-dependent flavin oxidoreductase YrpB (nitropropane dioxygenase family)
MSVIKTPITDLFGIQHPIILAGMNVAAGPELAAAVTNAGGLGVIGGVGYTPKVLRRQVGGRLLGSVVLELITNIDPRTQERAKEQECTVWSRSLDSCNWR